MEISLKEGYTETPDGDVMPPLELLAEDTGKYTEYKIWGTPIDGVLVWDRKRYDDNRGSVQELSKIDELSKVLGREIVVKQTMLSTNEHLGTFRGLHAEPMDKLITPVTGKVFIAIADIRPESKTFGQYVSFVIDQTDHKKARKTIFVANGLANSFLTLSGEEALYLYSASAQYKTSEGKRSIRWDDPDLNIKWPIDMRTSLDLRLSDPDFVGNSSLRELFPEKFND